MDNASGSRIGLFTLFLAILIAPATPHVPDSRTVTFPDVGQVDSNLVQAPNGYTMLVDAGESWATPTVSASLTAEGITRLEYVVATHDHDDHIGGMVGVLPQVTVGQFVTNGVRASAQTATNLRTDLSTHGIPLDSATSGDTLALDPANVTVTELNPPIAPARTRPRSRSCSGSSSETSRSCSPATLEPRPRAGCSLPVGLSGRGSSKSGTTVLTLRRVRHLSRPSNRRSQ